MATAKPAEAEVVEAKPTPKEKIIKIQKGERVRECKATDFEHFKEQGYSVVK